MTDHPIPSTIASLRQPGADIQITTTAIRTPKKDTMTTTRPTTTRRAATRLAPALLAVTALLGACANNPASEASDTGAAPTGGSAAPSSTAAGSGSTAATVGALLADSSAGDILVGSDGRALYGFTNDVDALSTCYGTCAEAWPPVIVGEDWTVGPGLDTGIFATTVRDDGQLQLVAGKWPLYYYAGDAVPGDTEGQGSGDVWFLIDPTGRLITDDADAGAGGDDTTAAASDGAGDYPAGGSSGGTPSGGGADGALLGTATTAVGEVLTDDDGLTLYGFTSDVDGEPSCYDACAQAWPPVLVDGQELPDGLDPEVFSVVERTDGTWQLVAGDWPLYRFGGDGAEGDSNGQGSGDKWWVAAPDGALIRS